LQQCTAPIRWTVQHQPEVGQVHLGEALVAQDAGIADQHVDPAPGVHRLLHHRLHRAKSVTEAPLAIASPPAARISSTTAARPTRAAGAVDGAAQVVDQHLGAARRQASACCRPGRRRAGDDGHAAAEIQLHPVSVLEKSEPNVAQRAGAATRPFVGRS
jgi:hypothetical protein